MKLIAQSRLEDGNSNSRGLSSPWKCDNKMKWRLQRRGTATLNLKTHYSPLATHNSSLITHCQTFLLLSTNRMLVSK
jgi:hypothetical protein